MTKAFRPTGIAAAMLGSRRAQGRSGADCGEINAEIVKLYPKPKFVDYLEKQAVQRPGTPAKFAAFSKKDRQAAEFLINIANRPREDYKLEP
jgi:hypothetical protein